MTRKLKVDRAIYLVDDNLRTYAFLKRNPHWSRLSPRQRQANKLQLDGYTRIFRDGRRQVLHIRRRSESDLPTLPTLTTARLVLRPFTLADVPDVQRLAGDREIASTSLHIPNPYPDGVAEQWISTHKDRFVRDEAAVFAVTRADTGEVIGANGLEIRRDHARAEMGYWIGKAFWNQGYATEAGREVLRFAFEDLQLERVFAEHFKRNPASGRVMQKLGMTREGELRRHIKKWGVREDIVIYAILRSEFSHQDEGARSASTG